MTTDKKRDFRQLGIKVSAETYAALNRRAKMRGMAPTTLARWYVLDQIGHTDQFTARKTGKRRVVKPFCKEKKQKIALLQELQLIRMYLQQLQPGSKRTRGNLNDVSRAELAYALDLAKQVFLNTLNTNAEEGR